MKRPSIPASEEVWQDAKRIRTIKLHFGRLLWTIHIVCGGLWYIAEDAQPMSIFRYYKLLLMYGYLGSK